MSTANVDVFPVPVDEELYIRTTGDLIQNIKLTSMHGVGVLPKFSFIEGNLWRVSCEGLGSGVYVMLIKTNAGLFRKKIVVD